MDISLSVTFYLGLSVCLSLFQRFPFYVLAVERLVLVEKYSSSKMRRCFSTFSRFFLSLSLTLSLLLSQRFPFYVLAVKRSGLAERERLCFSTFSEFFLSL